jgi:tRNA threonylcarbamoyladenosine biosynthesis protein TsaB
MPLILSIETSADACSVSLIDDDSVVSMEADEPRSHGRMLVPMIEQIMLQQANLDAVCVDAGPGSYTGLRIGVSTAKGLAWSLSIPLFAIPSLDLMAAALLEEHQHLSKPITIRCMIPARGSDVYSARYALTAEGLKCLEKPGVVNLDEWSPPEAVDVVLVSSSSLTEQLTGIADIRVLPPHSRHAAMLMRNQGAAYRVDDVSSFEPHYLRAFEARRPAKSIFDRLPF